MMTIMCMRFVYDDTDFNVEVEYFHCSNMYINAISTLGVTIYITCLL